MSSRLTVNVGNMILHLASLGYPITDAQQAAPLYNDNKACVKWCHNLPMKGNHHIEHRENATREWVADGTIAVHHVSSNFNPSDIFTKEMCGGANFCRLWDSFMCQATTFLKRIYNSLHPVSTQILAHSLDVAAQAAHYFLPSQPGLLEIFFRIGCSVLPMLYLACPMLAVISFCGLVSLAGSWAWCTRGWGKNS